MTVGQRIRAARVAAGLSQAQLAEKVGVKRQAANLWELNKAEPGILKLEAIASATGRSVSELLGTEASDIREPKTPEGLKGEVGKHLSAISGTLNTYLEAIIEAEVTRRLAERMADAGIVEGESLGPKQLDAVSRVLKDMRQQGPSASSQSADQLHSGTSAAPPKRTAQGSNRQRSKPGKDARPTPSTHPKP